MCEACLHTLPAAVSSAHHARLVFCPCAQLSALTALPSHAETGCRIPAQREQQTCTGYAVPHAEPMSSCECSCISLSRCLRADWKPCSLASRTCPPQPGSCASPLTQTCWGCLQCPSLPAMTLQVLPAVSYQLDLPVFVLKPRDWFSLDVSCHAALRLVLCAADSQQRVNVLLCAAMPSEGTTSRLSCTCVEDRPHASVLQGCRSGCS